MEPNPLPLRERIVLGYFNNPAPYPPYSLNITDPAAYNAAWSAHIEGSRDAQRRLREAVEAEHPETAAWPPELRDRAWAWTVDRVGTSRVDAYDKVVALLDLAFQAGRASR